MKRFLGSINLPTLFIRYVSVNEIIFITDDLTFLKVFTVEKDKNDTVSRTPIISNKELYYYFKNINFEFKQQNIKRYEKKKKYLFVKKSIIFLKEHLLKSYKHSRIYNIEFK